jgi:hypothetical protein
MTLKPAGFGADFVTDVGRSHPNMVLGAILLLAKLTVFCGLAWIIIAALVPST